jgi:hypothetical protein
MARRVLTLLALVLLISPAAAAPPAARGQSRTSLYPGQSFTIWTRAGTLPPFTAGWFGQPAYTLTGPDGKSVTLPRRPPGRPDQEASFDPLYHGEIVVPADARPGTHTLTAGDVTCSFQVAAPPKRAGRHRLAPGTTVATAQSWLDRGYDLLLDPGLFEWGRPVYWSAPADAPLRVPEGASITGPGAVIRPDPSVKPPPEAWWIAAFFSAPNATIDGLTFDLPGGRVVSNLYSPNLTLRKCKLVGCQLNDPGAGLLAEDCEVTGPTAGVFLIQGGVLRRVNFHDTSDGHAFAVWAAAGNLALIDCPFVRTDRAIVCQPNRGDIRGGLFLGTEIDSPRSENGRESFLCERPPAGTAFGIKDCLILHTVARTDGSAVQWDDVADNNLVCDYVVRGGLGFRLWGQRVSNNMFDGYKLDGGAKIDLAPGAAGNVFKNGPAPAEK